MSVEAITWALNFAPIPMDKGKTPKPNPACAAVLLGLANHADPDGTAAFPSVHLLVIYSRCSERTVRTALDRLEAEGVITPCDPDVIAAKIKRADRRPNGWDLNMRLLRDDLTPSDVTLLSRQFPWLPAALQAQQAADRGGSDEVQQLHPEETDPADGVRQLHPGESDGVQLSQERGAAVAPEPSVEPSGNHPLNPYGVKGVAGVPAHAIAQDPGAAQGDTGHEDGGDVADVPAKKRARGRRLPDDWTPAPHLLAWAAQEHPTVDAVAETETFRDHWLSSTMPNSRKLDWDRAWKNWIRRETKGSKRRLQVAPPPEVAEQAQPFVDEWWSWVQEEPRRRQGAVGRDRGYLLSMVCEGLQTGASIDDVRGAVGTAIRHSGLPVPEFTAFRRAMAGVSRDRGPDRATAAEVTAAITRDAVQDAAVEQSTAGDLAVAVANLANIANRSSGQGILDDGGDTPQSAVLPGKVIG